VRRSTSSKANPGLRQRRRLRRFSARVVVVGEAVDPEHLVSGRAQRLAQVAADEPGGSGDDDFMMSPLGSHGSGSVLATRHTATSNVTRPGGHPGRHTWCHAAPPGAPSDAVRRAEPARRRCRAPRGVPTFRIRSCRRWIGAGPSAGLPHPRGRRPGHALHVLLDAVVGPQGRGPLDRPGAERDRRRARASMPEASPAAVGGPARRTGRRAPGCGWRCRWPRSAGPSAGRRRF
jgi:hypothetical protein